VPQVRTPGPGAGRQPGAPRVAAGILEERRGVSVPRVPERHELDGPHDNEGRGGVIIVREITA